MEGSHGNSLSAEEHTKSCIFHAGKVKFISYLSRLYKIYSTFQLVMLSSGVVLTFQSGSKWKYSGQNLCIEDVK